MLGIKLGRCPSSNTITFYNPNTRSYYNPPSYRLDESCHTSSQFSRCIKYDGVIILVLYRNKRDPTPEPFPPGTRIPLLLLGVIKSANVEHLPLIPADGSIPPADPPYLIRFDDSTSNKLKYEDLSKAMHPSATSSSPTHHDDIGLPTLFQYISKDTMDINGVFQKG